ncbi:unnamed protein product [Moneuplotes crassus]|uniref:Uncharacterized protein n=1 Tax=Euplotes crassus TaxID=5936 RepID=A0AAD1Y8P5_EUPCR|nr:unnamed protein product [Moneuplotes crassus]
MRKEGSQRRNTRGMGQNKALWCMNRAEDVYSPKQTKISKPNTERMMRRRNNRKKSEYQKFLKTVAPDLMIPKQVLNEFSPDYNPNRAFFASRTAQNKKQRSGGGSISKQRFESQKISISRLSPPQTARVKSRNMLKFGIPMTQAEALNTINSIYKPKLATLDGRIHRLKTKKRHLIHLESELISLTQNPVDSPMEEYAECSISDSSEDNYDTSNLLTKNLWNKVKIGKRKLFNIQMMQDTLNHMLKRDELILYCKKIKINGTSDELIQCRKKHQAEVNKINLYHKEALEYRMKAKELSHRISRFDTIKYMRQPKNDIDVCEYIDKLIGKKLQIKSQKPTIVFEELESPIKRKAAQIEKEKTMRRVSRLERKLTKNNLPSLLNFPKDIVAKINNDPEFAGIPEEELNIQTLSSFVTKQMLNVRSLTDQCKELETEAAKKSARLNELLAKLKNKKLGLDTNSRKKKSEAKSVYLHNFHRMKEISPPEKLIERKKLISNILIFISRVLHQLETYEYGELKAHKKLENIQRNILANMSYLGMCLDHISIKTILQEPATGSYLQLSGLKSPNSHEALHLQNSVYNNPQDQDFGDIGIQQILYVSPTREEREKQQNRMDRRMFSNNLFMNESDKNIDKEYEYNIKVSQAEMDYIEKTYRQRKTETATKNETIKPHDSTEEKKARKRKQSSKKVTK